MKIKPGCLPISWNVCASHRQILAQVSPKRSVISLEKYEVQSLLDSKREHRRTYSVFSERKPCLSKLQRLARMKFGLSDCPSPLKSLESLKSGSYNAPIRVLIPAWHPPTRRFWRSELCGRASGRWKVKPTLVQLVLRIPSAPGQMSEV